MFERVLLVLIGVIAFQAPAYSARFAFSSPVNVGPAGATAVAAADFNGDGRDDLAAVVQSKLLVYLQQGNSTLAPALTFEIYGTRFGTVQVADLGADGTTDILAGHEMGLAVYKWSAANGFMLDDHRASYACWNIASADLDGDGAPDVACLGTYADAMLFYSDPGAVLSAPVYMQTAAMSGGTLGQLQLKDVTGDGKPDLLVASGPANSFFVYPNDGDRGFLPAVAYPYPAEVWSHSVEALDLDSDDANEVVVTAPCNMPCASLFTYRQGEAGYLELSRTIPTLDIPDALIASDIDRDGDQDLLVGHNGWYTIGRYMVKGDGLPSTELWSSVSVQHGSRGLAVGDFDHDGHRDLAVANTFGVSLLFGGRQAASDFDGDHVSDLVWRNGAGENVLWKSADSTKLQSLPARDPSWSGQAIGDFDGDGVADLFLRNRMTGENEILSAGVAQATQPISVTSQDWQVVGSGDFDGDGRDDLLWRNSANGANAIWKSGDSATPQAIGGMGDTRWKVAGVGDFNGDGEWDILWRHAGSGSNVIWRSGRGETPQAVTAVPDLRWTVVGVGDFNGDGKDDVTWRHTGTGSNGIWLSASSATQLTVTSVTNQAWSVAAVGDYNGDGRADLMWRNSTSGDNVIWRSADSRQTQAVRSVSGWNIAR